MDEIGVGREQYLVWRLDIEGIAVAEALAKAQREFAHYNTYPVDPNRPAWLQDLLARLEKEGIIPVGELTPALQATERYFQILA